MVEFGIYLPQLAYTAEQILDRALLCEELGFSSLWLMDHLYPPELPAETEICGLQLEYAKSANDFPRGYTVELSADGEKWGAPVAVVLATEVLLLRLESP